MMLRSLPFLFLCFSTIDANVFAQTPFYQDKMITVVLGGPPAGSADLRTRGVINILRKHIPGNPTIVMQYMGAGGGRQAANHVYGVAKPDGLTIGSMGAALVANAVLGEPGVQYDIDKFTLSRHSRQRATVLIYYPPRRRSGHPGKTTFDAGRPDRRPIRRPSRLHYGPALRLYTRYEGAEIRCRIHRPRNRCRHRAAGSGRESEYR